MTPGATGGFHSRGLSRLILGRMGGYFGFLRPGVLRLGGEVETSSAPAGLMDVSDVVDEPVSRGVDDVTLERDSTVELALARGAVTARSRQSANIACHDNQRLSQFSIFYCSCHVILYLTPGARCGTCAGVTVLHHQLRRMSERFDRKYSVLYSISCTAICMALHDSVRRLT
jgi:hypothetical protein